MANLTITDFDSFYKCLEYASYMSEDVSIDFEESKMEINLKNSVSRLSIESSSVIASEKCQINLANIKLFLVALKNAQASIKDVLIDKIVIEVSKAKLIIKTNNSKTSLHQSSIDIISSKSTNLKSIPDSVINFTIFKESFKKINSSVVYIPNSEDARIELNQNFEDIGNDNLMMAKIYACNTPLSNYSFIDVGEIRSINSEIQYPIILDVERLNLISLFATSDKEFLEISALKIPALMLKTDFNSLDSRNSIIFISSILK